MKKLNVRQSKKPSAKIANKSKSFPVVAIGASVGGLKAISLLLKHLPVDTGMAFIYVQHLSIDHKSFLSPILSRITKMKVQEIDDMEFIKPNNVYVIPHNKGIEVIDGHIKLLPRTKKGSAISIDVLFSSLSETHKDNVIGIILSGNARDGTKGLKAIKDAGGMTIAQDDTAQAGSMPHSAIDAGVVDFVLSPKEIAIELGRMGENGFKKRKVKKNESKKSGENFGSGLKSIFGHLHKETGVDFSHYKMASVKRRLKHRMLLAGVQGIKEYAKILPKRTNETDLLYKDLLINVTCFFRDPETFRYLKTTFLPKLLKSKTGDEALRIWVPACSTGEEVYSYAMLITELQDNKKKKIPVQIFATDLSDHAIHIARIGEYSQNDMRPVSKEYQKRFFTKSGDHYRIIKEIREMCVFAPHNILRDPPFFRMDFISCRNLLIYFDAPAQKKALATLHFALNDGKYLILGKSETIGTSSQLFMQINTKFKIYSRRKNIGLRKVSELLPDFPRTTVFKKSAKTVSSRKMVLDSAELDGAIDAVLLSRFMPACAVINKDMEILQFRGSSSVFLSHSQGKASLNILKMTRPEFAFELRTAIHKAIKTNLPVRNSGIEMEFYSGLRMMSLEVCPLKIEWGEPLLLVVFSLEEHIEKDNVNINGKEKGATRKDLRIKKLSEELNNARTEIHSVLESQETSYEELQAANEEIVSANEEFQTLNEELETSKEEIEATNEELISTNQELKTHNELLAESYNYAQTIIATIHEPMVVLNDELNVKSANKSFYKKFHVTIEETEGISLFELGNKQWDIPKLRGLLENVLSKNSNFENLEIIHAFPGMGEKVMVLNANRIIQKTHREKLILLAIEDITERTVRQRKEREYLRTNIRVHQEDKILLEKAVRRRTRQLQQKNVELESVNKDLTTFTYVSSHDLQEPLRKIQNFVSYIQKKEEKNLSDDGKGYFNRMQETAKRMQLLIEDLLTYSRAKSTDRNFEKVNLNIIIDEVKTNLDEAIHEKQAIIKVHLGVADVIPFQFRQVMQNLIGNSIKFSRPKIRPRISITGKVVKGNKLNIEKLSTKNDYYHILFTDNGIGFDPQYKERIFEVFQRLHSYEKYKGTGIGLAICKRIIENHNGVIMADGKPNKGVKFDIYIPVL